MDGSYHADVVTVQEGLAEFGCLLLAIGRRLFLAPDRTGKEVDHRFGVSFLSILRVYDAETKDWLNLLLCHIFKHHVCTESRFDVMVAKGI